MAPRPPRKVTRPVWATAEYTDADLYAVRAVARGNANPEQQRRAIDWVIRRACQTYDEQFVPDSPRVTDFLLGRRSVGQQIIKLINVTTTTETENG